MEYNDLNMQTYIYIYTHANICLLDRIVSLKAFYLLEEKMKTEETLFNAKLVGYVNLF